MKKGLITLLTAVGIMAASAVTAAASGFEICYDGATHLYTGSVYELFVNGEQINSPIEPIIFNDHAVVPIREVFEACGAEVEYDAEKQCAEVQYGNMYIRVYINDNCAYVNGKKYLIPDDVVPKLINKPDGETKTMVPVRFIGEAAGMTVDFVSESGRINITSAVKTTEAPTEEPTEEPTPEPTAEPTEEPTEAPVWTPTETEAPVTETETKVEEATQVPEIYIENDEDSQGRKPTMKGIDISEHQGNIDWEKLKDNVDFVIIRCGYGSDIASQDDKMWKTNVEACVKYNIPFGVYLYSYANTEEKAASEAQHVLRLIDGYYPQLPIFYDMEDKIQAALTNEERGKIAEIFCDAISDAGYEVGIYANKNWWSNYLTDSAFDNQSWYRWVAQYNSSCTYSGNYVMWQYSDAGSLDGVGTKLDVNFWYGDVITAN